MQGRSLDTLGELLESYDLHPSCASPRCARCGPRLDSVVLLKRYGPDFPLAELIRRLRCTACRSPDKVRIAERAGRAAPSIADHEPFISDGTRLKV